MDWQRKRRGGLAVQSLKVDHLLMKAMPIVEQYAVHLAINWTYRPPL